MLYIIYKHRNYQDFGNKRIDVGLYYVEEKIITKPKDIALFANECCKRFLEEDVFFDDREGAYIECAKRNKEVIDSFLAELKEN